MTLSIPPEPVSEIKIPLLNLAPRDRPRMACLPGALPSYLWAYWKSALRGRMTWQEFQTDVRRSRWDFADWVADATTRDVACQTFAASLSTS